MLLEEIQSTQGQREWLTAWVLRGPESPFMGFDLLVDLDIAPLGCDVVGGLILKIPSKDVKVGKANQKFYNRTATFACRGH